MHSKKYEEEITLHKEASRVAKLLYNDSTINDLLQSMADAVILINKSGKIVFVNKQINSLFGYKKDELLGESLSILIDPEVREQHNHHISAFFKKPQKRPMGKGMDLWGMKKNKIKIPIEISISFFKSEYGEFAIAFVSDISIRKKVENDLITKNKQLDEFAGIVAHDLKNNINNIVGFSNLLVQSKENFNDEDLDTIVKQILKNANKMSDVIRELLIFSRLKQEDIKLVKINMKNIIEEALERNRMIIRENNSEIKYNEIHEGVLGNAPWIEEIWYNLINNAVNYCGENTIIEIGSNLVEDKIEYYISDNGPGIDPKYHEELFKDMSATKREIVKGNGIGLPVAKKIITKLGGDIWIESKLGEGTTFKFTLKKG